MNTGGHSTQHPTTTLQMYQGHERQEGTKKLSQSGGGKRNMILKCNMWDPDWVLEQERGTSRKTR